MLKIKKSVEFLEVLYISQEQKTIDEMELLKGFS